MKRAGRALWQFRLARIWWWSMWISALVYAARCAFCRPPCVAVRFNPFAVEGQVQGGIAKGLDMALMENISPAAPKPAMTIDADIRDVPRSSADPWRLGGCHGPTARKGMENMC